MINPTKAYPERTKIRSQNWNQSRHRIQTRRRAFDERAANTCAGEEVGCNPGRGQLVAPVSLVGGEHGAVTRPSPSQSGRHVTCGGARGSAAGGRVGAGGRRPGRDPPPPPLLPARPISNRHTSHTHWVIGARSRLGSETVSAAGPSEDPADPRRPRASPADPTLTPG